MENATKALIMAAAILISVVIISLGLYLAITLSNYSSQIDEDNRRNQIAQFNSQFLKYQGSENNTIYDILTVANLAKQNNDNYELTSRDANQNTLYIRVNVIKENGTRIIDFQNNALEFANNYDSMQGQIENGELIRYTCNAVKVSPITERVYEIEFEEIPRIM